MRHLLPLALFACVTACTQAPSPVPQDSEKLTQDFIYGTLALSPVSATQAGYHQHNGTVLDDLLDDYSAGGLEQQRGFCKGIQDRANAMDAAKLDKEQRADLDIIKSNAGLEPRITVVPIGNDKSLRGGLKLAGSNSDTQTLKLTLVPPAQGPTTRGLATGPRGAGPPIAPVDEDRLERSKSRNLLESIDDKLRRQNLGN